MISIRKYFFTITSSQTVEFECLANQIANDIWSISIYRKEGNNYTYVTNIGTSVDSGYIINHTRDLDAGEYYVIFNGDFTNNYNGTVNFIAKYRDKKVSNITSYLLGGGIRINSISYFDKFNDIIPVKKVNFNYNNINSPQKSSGALIFPKPVHSYNYDYNNLFVYECSSTTPCKQSFTNNFTIFSTENFLPVQKTHGADIGYQNVAISEINKGEDIFTYTSPIDKPNPEQISYIVPPFTAIGNYDYKRGLLVNEEIKDNNNILLYKKSNQYITYDSEKLSGITLRHGGSPFTEYLYAGNFKTYEAYLSGCVNAVPNPACSSNSIDMIAITNYREIIGKANVSSLEETHYLNNPIKATKIYEYNNLDYPIKQKNISPDETINEIIYQYAHEKGNQLMINKNMVGIPLETVSTQTIGNSTKTLSKSETIYPLNQTEANTKTSGLVLPISVKSYDLQNPASAYTEVTYDKYDNKGNLQQYTTKDGLAVTIIWGYNGTQPIAKIEGAKLSEIQQSFIDAIVNASNTDASAASGSDESALLTALNTFRNNLPAYQVTTYTYDPLIGVRSITPPSGITEKYIYDAANRLQKIVDVNGQVLKEYKYNYKN